jgi:N-acetylneuraminic acid mutarotase
MKRITLPILLIILVAGYLYYVRGVGIPPRASQPAVIERGGAARTYEWTAKAAMPTARSEVAAAALNGKIYVVGGFDGFGRTLPTVEAYEPATDTWQPGPSLPEGRHHAVAVSVGNSLYVIGGYSGLGFEPQATVFALDAQSALWREVAPLPAARGAMAGAAADGRIYVAAGVGPDGLANDLFVYDAAQDRWALQAPAPTKRDHLTAAALGGFFYLAGGREKSLSKNLSALEIYDPAANTWRAGPAMPTARGGVAGATIGGLFVVVGGEQPTGTYQEVEAFDPAQGRWLPLPGLPTPRHGLAAVSMGDVLYAIGGGKKPGLSVSGTNEALQVR